jgi:hypothetical protein
LHKIKVIFEPHAFKIFVQKIHYKMKPTGNFSLIKKKKGTAIPATGHEGP